MKGQVLAAPRQESVARSRPASPPTSVGKQPGQMPRHLAHSRPASPPTSVGNEA